MLRTLYKILYFAFPRFLMKRFIRKQQMKTLGTISEFGHYKNRLFIAKQLDELTVSNRLEITLILLNDPIETISQYAIETALDMELNSSQEKLIAEKVAHWKKLQKENAENEQKIKELLKDTTHTKRKFSNGETYQEMKVMIKKPMNLGKWF